MKKILIYICFGVTLYFFQSCSTPFAPDEEEFADLEGEIGNEVSANNIPSLAAFVVKDDSIVWQQYYGYADVASRRDANKYTIYGLASVSKLIVVTAVMQLKERGLINLDTDISDYLPFSVRNPNYPDDKLTVFNLLTHTSGLNWPENDSEVPGYYRHYPFDNSPPLREWIPEFILPDGANYVSAVWMNHRPGEREWYSNIGACLLAYLVEVVSGMDYNEYCKQNIFEPLEMFNTSHAYADLDINNLATLYYQPTQQIEFFRYQGYPAGDLKSTIERSIQKQQNIGREYRKRDLKNSQSRQRFMPDLELHTRQLVWTCWW
jgi:CubicO group peptidase (beta-lactamase class C family)